MLLQGALPSTKEEEQGFDAVLCLAYLHPFRNEYHCDFLHCVKHKHLLSKLWKKTYSAFNTLKRKLLV